MTNKKLKQPYIEDPPPGRFEKMHMVLHDLFFRSQIAKADLIYCIDETTGLKTLEFGRAVLKQLIKGGKARTLTSYEIPLKAETLEYEALCAAILNIKGYYDNAEQHRTTVDLGPLTAVAKNPREIH
jgi:hypothetical protein